MSDIFDEIDKDINLTKNKNKKDEDEKNRIEKEIDKFKEKIFKLNCSADFNKLHTLLKKHTKDDNKIKINQITEPYDCRLELSQKLYGPDGNYTNYRDQKSETGILWNDKDLKIQWPVKKAILSAKDNNNIKFSQFKKLIW